MRGPTRYLSTIYRELVCVWPIRSCGACADSANSCSQLITRALFGPVLLKPVHMCAQRKGIIGRIQEQLEPSVPGTTIVNDGSIFAVLGLWCALASELHSQLNPASGRSPVPLRSVQHALTVCVAPRALHSSPWAFSWILVAAAHTPPV